MHNIKTEGFVLKRIPYQKERTKLFSILTKDFGKILVSVNSTKKISSSINTIAPLNICQFELYKTPNGYFRVKNVILKQSFYPIGKDTIKQKLQIIQRLYTITETINKTIEDNHKDKLLYELLVKTSILLYQTNNDLIFETFTIKLLFMLGNLPNLKHCFICQKKFNKEMKEIFFNKKDLHVYCITCKKTKDYIPTLKLEFNTLKVLHFIATSPFQEIINISIPTTILHNLRLLNTILLKQILDKELITTKKSLI